MRKPDNVLVVERGEACPALASTAATAATAASDRRVATYPISPRSRPRA